MTFGEKIKKYRKNLKMTQDELAKLVGYNDRSSIAKIESGDRDVPQSVIIKFAEPKRTHTNHIRSSICHNASDSKIKKRASEQFINLTLAFLCRDERTYFLSALAT